MAVLSLFNAGTSMADSTQYGQYGQYGGGQPSYTIMIDKMVATGQKTKGGQQTFVDNLSSSDTKFAPGTRVEFQVKVKNTSNITLNDVKVQDVLPSYLDAFEGPGEYNTDTRTISWTYGELKSGEEKIERVLGQIKSQGELPADKSIVCQSNLSKVNVGTAYDEDTAQFCIEKQVVGVGGQPVKTTPEAGAPLLAIGVLNLLGLGTGVWLKKRV